MTALCCSLVLDRPNLNVFGKIGVGISIIGGVFAILSNFFINSLDGFASVVMWRYIFLIIAISLAHISLLMKIVTNNLFVRFARGLTISSIALVALGFLSIVLPSGFGFAMPESVFTISIILDVLGTLATPILNKAVKST
ncbi:MAG: hypothetical protein IM585_10790 [Pseudanabaena sp. M135S2SP2A07QC]|nr:hypothetical protein [Pseudanabaena sp. M090S1SP2A07QC]MCA6506474.1 hypothetical protein [Pseudanabaena sp. M172S2SP2A07QC]MCA6518347.1 hypothetical protein [Pseudanabaena sp. M110S1SP2A07QC]MCA6524996.1 hypothetical protein [Pseudanabaena sp. M179S2SP2A07QC]MCA6540468.1 hypothetical protein [Pseudanabaena sp. M037S2SP2A07QC]MCA6547592.1 hypothetical protein [Pseudanabaena sp. M152S2SP2A07QC]MCA6552467.1 hypothetical protein [Pseudanabaena sp. M135S2SP2A07QC]MCA6558212.1 hypothetical prot